MVSISQIEVNSQLALKICIGIFCGTIIGIERQVRGKPVGIRTSILVCMSTIMFIILGRSIEMGRADSTRVLAQLISGVGFLGAGVIMTKNGIIEGVTSASSIWLLAAVGAAIGFDQLQFAVLFSVICVGVLIGVEWCERAFQWLRKGVHAHKQDIFNNSKKPRE